MSEDSPAAVVPTTNITPVRWQRWLVLGILGIVLAWPASLLREQYLVHRAIAEIQSGGGYCQVEYDWFNVEEVLWAGDQGGVTSFVVESIWHWQNAAYETPGWKKSLALAFPKLKLVSVSGQTFDDAWLMRLPKRHLAVLGLEDCPIHDRGLRSLSATTGLHLGLSKYAVTDETLLVLPANLGTLDLSSASITSDQARHLSRFSELWELNLDDTAISDANIHDLPRSLMILSLNGTHLNDASVADLSTFPALQSLEIVDTHITEQGVQRLREKLGTQVHIGDSFRSESSSHCYMWEQPIDD